MAHDEAGVPVEAAASLFGAGDDSAIDFFSSSLNEGGSQEQTTTSHGSDVAANLFEAGPDESTISSFPDSVSHDPWPSNAGGVLNGESNIEVTPGVHVDSQADYNSVGYQSQGWQDEHGQWYPYDNQTQYTSTYNYASQAPSTDYYAPRTEYQSHTSGQITERSTGYAASQQTNYANPQSVYAPQQTSHRADYSPQAYSYAVSPAVAQNSAYSQAQYNPYAPSVPANASVSTVNPGAQGTESLQSPKDVNAYRPSTLNAYDPPMAKVRSRVRPAFYASQPSPPMSNGVHYQYAGAPQPSSIPPPPPPAAHSVNGPRPLTSYPVAGQSLSASEGFHDDGTSTWSQGMERTHDVGLSTYHNQQGAAFGNASVDYTETVETSAYSQADPQDIGVEQVSSGIESMSITQGGDYAENGLIPAGASAVRTTSSFAASQSQGSLTQPLNNDQLSIAPVDLGRPNFSPPPLTGSPVDYSHTPQPATIAGSQNGSVDGQLPYDPYAPATHSRANSDASHTGSTYSNARVASSMPRDPYAPPKPSATRKGSNASSIHTSYGRSSVVGVPAPNQDPYAPTTGLRRTQSRQSQHSFDDEYTSRYNNSHEPDLGMAEDLSSSTADSDAMGYSNVLTAPTYAPYAPSPSLLGTNDPLGRASARVPVISFGFGGKLVTCFHSAGETASGFDVSLTSRQCTTVQISTLHEVIPASAMDSSASSYPGPLFSDTGASSISLARTVGVGTANNIKAKKALVSKWLEERSSELSSGVAHIPSGSQERYNAEGKLVLVRLLMAMVENDGQLSGSPSIEWAVRSALIPRLEAQGPSTSADRLSASEHALNSYASTLADPNEPSLAVYNLRSSALDRIQEFLLRGERHQAYHYALDEKLWAHAMLIASSVDTQAWKEVVNEFLHSELSVKPPPRPLPGIKSEDTSPLTNGRESLRVAYSLFAGYGAAAVQELVPPKAVPAAKDSLLVASTGLHTTPISPNFPQPALTSSVPLESLAKWQETAAIMAFSQTTGDSAALTALGDYLAANRWFEAAHACYLLSPRTSSLGGAGLPSVRIVLVGCESPATRRNFNKDLDVTLLSEIVEFALSLSPPKGQEAFGGLPHLQAYKLVRAFHLAEMGHVEIANRYCEAIGSTIRASTRGSQFYTPTFIGELKNLSDRLTAAPQSDKTASWISRKMAKPSLDTIGSWLEGRFSKLIVGEGEDNAEPPINDQYQPPTSTHGPFSHYSTISSAATSASPSPTPTPHAFSLTATASDMPFGHAHVQMDRASSAMDHFRPEARRPSPVPRVASASAATTTFAQSYAPTSRYRSTLGGVGGVPESDGLNDSEGQELSWWGSASHDRSGPTPTAATFHKVDEAESGGNFVSLMDDFSSGITPIVPKSSQSQSRNDINDDDEEDLGFGNSTSKKQKADTSVSASEPKDKPKEEPKTAPSKPELKQQSSSWLGRWWNRSSEPAQSGPIKAKLGEETSFYYDKDLKRWVNKKADNTETAPTLPPPPPSRPRTASPAPSGPANGSGTPPQTRPASAADLTMPPRRPPRVRSSLVPTDDTTTPGSAPPSATSFENSKSGPGPTPPSGVGIGRPKSSASKRNVRSRYVDVFQQQSQS